MRCLIKRQARLWQLVAVAGGLGVGLAPSVSVAGRSTPGVVWRIDDGPNEQSEALVAFFASNARYLGTGLATATFTSGVVTGGPQQPVLTPRFDIQQQRVSARNQQCREWRHGVAMLERRREEVAFHMMDAKQRIDMGNLSRRLFGSSIVTPIFWSTWPEN